MSENKNIFTDNTRIQIKLHVQDRRELIASGDLIIALLKIAMDLEHLFFYKLYFEKQISLDLIDNWTLGRYIQWSLSLGLVDGKWRKMLNNFSGIRNDIIHDRSYSERIMADKEKQKGLKMLLSSMCDFIEQNEVNAVTGLKTQELQKKLFEHFRKKEQNRKL